MKRRWSHVPQGVYQKGRRCHADAPAGAFGGTHYGATNRVRGVPKWGGEAMRTLRLGPSVEHPMGSRTA
eukprot:9088430-Pyramimonas_sp.AAC.1